MMTKQVMTEEEILASISKMLCKIQKTKHFMKKLVDNISRQTTKPLKFKGNFVVIRDDELMYLRLTERNFLQTQKMLNDHLENILKK